MVSNWSNRGGKQLVKTSGTHYKRNAALVEQASGWSTLDILLACAVGFIAIKKVNRKDPGALESVVQGVVLKLLLDNAVSPASPYCPDRQINCVDRSRSTKGCTCAT